MTRLNEALKAQQATAIVQQQEQPVIVSNFFASRQYLFPTKENYHIKYRSTTTNSQATNVVSVVEHSIIKLTNAQLKMQYAGDVIYSTCVNPN